MYDYIQYLDWIGNCIQCGAPAYWNDEEQKTIFKHPEPGCLCIVEHEEDE